MIRSNTQRGVNEVVARWLEQEKAARGPLRLLDAPCGAGQFLAHCQAHGLAVTGEGYDIDVSACPAVPGLAFTAHDLSAGVPSGAPVSAATCISGVMEFENTFLFLQSLKARLAPGALCIITNDNVHTVRDRFSYLLFNRYRRYALFLEPGFSTYKAWSLPGLRKCVLDAGFRLEEIEFITTHREDWLWAPVAALLYVPQFLYLLRERGPMPTRERRRLFPFRSLLCRHYAIVLRA